MELGGHPAGIRQRTVTAVRGLAAVCPIGTAITDGRRDTTTGTRNHRGSISDPCLDAGGMDYRPGRLAMEDSADTTDSTAAGQGITAEDAVAEEDRFCPKSVTGKVCLCPRRPERYFWLFL